MSGRLYAVGVGPGDPELLTLKAARLIRAADVVAYHSGTHGRSIARSIVADLIGPDVVEELLDYPVTTGAEIDYYERVDRFYDASAARLAAHLEAGRDVVVLAEGDPLFYSSFSYLHDRLAKRFGCEVVPGVTSISAASVAAATPLARHEDVLTVLPGTLPVAELARRLADTQAAVIMKLGRTFPAVVEALHRSGRVADAFYVERASTGTERVGSVLEVDPESVPYFSLIIVPGQDRRADAAGRAPTSSAAEPKSGGQAAPARGRSRPRTRPLADPRGIGRTRDGRSCRRLRSLPRPGAAPARSDPASQWQHSRTGPRPAGPRPGSIGRAGGRGLRWRRRRIRDGGRCFRGRGRSRVRRGGGRGATGPDSRPGRGRSSGSAAGSRLRGALTLRPAQAVGGDRDQAPGGCGGRSGAGDLQPGLADPDPPGEAGQGDPAGVPRRGDPGRGRPRHRPGG